MTVKRVVVVHGHVVIMYMNATMSAYGHIKILGVWNESLTVECAQGMQLHGLLHTFK